MPTLSLIWFIPLPPILAFFLIVLATNRHKGLSHTIAVGAALLSWLGAMLVFFRAIAVHDLGQHPFASSVNWIPTGDTWLKIGVLVDPLAAIVLFFVAWTVLMIFLYSIGYHNFGQPVGDHDQPGLPPHGATIQDGGHEHHSLPGLADCLDDGCLHRSEERHYVPRLGGCHCHVQGRSRACRV